MDTYRIRVILISGIQFRTGYQNQAKSSLEQGQVCGGPAAPPPPPPRLVLISMKTFRKRHHMHSKLVFENGAVLN